MPRRRGLAAVLLTLAIGLLVILPAAFLVGVLVNEAIGVVGGASAALAAQHVSGLDDVFRIPAVHEALVWVEAKSGVTPAELLAKAGELAQGVYGVLARFSGGVVKGLFDAVLTFLVTLFLLFFLFRDGREMVRALLDLVPLEEERRVALLGSLRGMLQSIFRGSLLTALIQGAAGGIGWLIAGPAVALPRRRGDGRPLPPAHRRNGPGVGARGRSPAGFRDAPAWRSSSRSGASSSSRWPTTS